MTREKNTPLNKTSHAERAARRVSASSVSASSTQAVLPWQQQRQMLKTLKQVQGNFIINTVGGFTLIELLVVVLIIGILAAVALPQYQLSVAKSHLSNVKLIMNAITKAEKSYFLENGSYTDDRTLLDLTFEQCENKYSTTDNSVLGCDSYWVIDIIFANQPVLDALYCPGYASSYSTCNQNKELTYRVWFDDSAPDECTGHTDWGKRICKNNLK